MPDRVVSKSFPFLKMRKGESNLAVDLDNEMTSIVVAENGGTKSAVALHPLVRAFYGTQSVIGDCTVTASSSDANVTSTYNTTTHCVDVSIQQNVHLSDVTTITITVTHSTYGTRVIYFIIAAVRDGIDAFIQELLPSLNEISFARQSDNSLSPSSRSLTLSFKKTKGETVTIQSISESGLTVRWSASSMPATASDGNNWGNGTSTGISWNNITMNIANNASASNIYIAAFKFVDVNTYVLVDRETIPVIKDGNNGDDALTLALDTYAIAFPTDSNYSVESQITYTVGARMYLGNSSIPRTITSLTASLDVADGDIDVSRTSPANGVVIDLGEARFANIIGVNVTAVCAEGTRTAKIILTAAPKGKKGTRGKIGRFFYYEGEWNDFASTDDFDVTDAQAPYFHYNNNYWVFNPETNGTYTKQNMGTPSSSSSNWKLMTNDFKYIITEALFGAYAHLGSFIINDDWLISQHGTINGQASANYTQFDPDHPNDNTGTNFIPNFAVDGLTGKTYQNDAYIRGEVHATSGTFNGILKAVLMYSPTANAASGTWSIQPSFNNPACYFCQPNLGGSTIILPSPVTYDGLEISFLTPFGTRQTGSTWVRVDVNASYTIHFSPYDAVTINGNIYYLPRQDGTLLLSHNRISLPYNQLIKIKAINGEWYVIEGRVEASDDPDA